MTIDKLDIEIKSSSSKATTAINKLKQSLEKLDKTSTKNTSSLGSLNEKLKAINMTAKLGAIAIVANRTGKAIGGLIQKSNEYIENLNLFNVSLGEFADEAKAYAEQVSEVMGIDPSDWLRAQGIFNTLATGFGLSSKQASIMSKNLTQLSYDISSLYNIKVQDAMTKLQSAFSGELEPVRRLGYDLSQTKLQAIAYSKGIELQVSEMTQAEKSMLRYYALMTQVTEAQGDMARTLDTPANQLRIFNAQISQLARALGNIFIPLLNKVLPYLIAITKVLRNLVNNIATFFGYKIPEIDYSTVNNLGSEISDNFEDANSSAKKLKNTVMGFDELNILGDNASETSNILDGLRFELDLPEYDFLAGLTENKSNSIYEKITNKLDKLRKVFGKIQEIDLTNFRISFDKFTSSLERLSKIVVDNLIKLIEKVIYPLVTWTIEEALPRFFEILSSALDLFLTILEKLEPVAQTWYNDFLVPIAQFAGEKFLEFLDNFNDEIEELEKFFEETTLFDDLKTISEEMIKVLKPMVEYLITTRLFLAELTVTVGMKAIKKFFEILEDIIGAIVDLLKGDFKSSLEHILDLLASSKIDLSKDKLELINEKLLEIDKTIGDKFSEENLKRLGENIGKAFGNAIVKLKDTKTKIEEFIENEVDPLFSKERWLEKFSSIKEAMFETMNNIYEWFAEKKWREAGDNLLDGLANGINGAISGLENLTNTIIGFFNSIIDGYNEIADKNPLMKKIDNIDTVDFSKYKINRYGSEGYATAGQMFYSKTNNIPEIESTTPENNGQMIENISQAVYNAIVNANQGKGDSNFNIYLDGRQINASVEKAKKEKGTSIMTGGLLYG